MSAGAVLFYTFVAILFIIVMNGYDRNRPRH